MESNKQLSIVVPTYNRADFLDYSLEVHIPLIRKYNIQIYIFDNSSTDNTEKIVLKWMREYPYLSYHKSEINIGPDANFERALKYPVSDYIWLLSDTYQVPRNGIDYLLKTINNTEKDYDIIVFNLAEKIKISTKNYQTQNDLLTDLGTIMTCAAINVYNKKLISSANFSRYHNSNFIQTGIIFESISDKDFLIHWVQSESVDGFKNSNLQKTNWSYTPYVFEIGCEKWINFVMSLPPSYKLENKMKCIMAHGKVSGLFSFKNLLILRMKNILNITTFFKYQSLFALTIDYPKFFILLLSIIPKSAIKLLYILFKQYKVYYRKKRNN